MSRESSERNMWSPASYDTLHMSAGRPAYASDRSCSKQKREEKTTNTNSISWRRRGRCWRRRNRNTTTCEDRAGYRRTQQEMEREKEKRKPFSYSWFSQFLFWFSLHETRVSVSFSVFLFRCIFRLSSSAVRVWAEPLSADHLHNDRRRRVSVPASQHSVFVRHFKTTVEFARLSCLSASRPSQFCVLFWFSVREPL